jgi:hypothetical protein
MRRIPFLAALLVSAALLAGCCCEGPYGKVPDCDPCKPRSNPCDPCAPPAAAAPAPAPAPAK